MVFNHYDKIDETWMIIRTAILNYDMQGCAYASCSTMRYDPTVRGPGPDKIGVICVHTSKYDIDAIGFRLIEITQQDIKYKLDDESRDNHYVHAGSGQVSMKTIYWNNGKPSFDCLEKPCRGTSYDKQDLWHLNVVNAPKPFATRSIYGRWVLPLKYKEMTGLWHYLKKLIESEEGNFGAIKMVCPPKRNRQSATEVPVIHVYTSNADRETVGTKLVNLIERDIRYEKISVSGVAIEGSYTLFWNDGEPECTKNRECTLLKQTSSFRDRSSSASCCNNDYSAHVHVCMVLSIGGGGASPQKFTASSQKPFAIKLQCACIRQHFYSPKPKFIDRTLVCIVVHNYSSLFVIVCSPSRIPSSTTLSSHPTTPITTTTTLLE